MNQEIAEIAGAFIGDGWIESDQDAIYITGNQLEDRDYYDNFISIIFSKYFAKVVPKNFSYWKVYGIAFYKRCAIRKAIELGFPIGQKSLTAKVPKWVLISKDKNIIKAFVRGVFDTDGSFWCEKSNAPTSKIWRRKNNYIPQLGITSCSKILLIQIQRLLSKLNFKTKLKQKNKEGFRHKRKIHDSFMLMIRNKQDIERWFQIIGTNNLRHKTRYKVWKKLGYLPPKTNIKSRIKMLEK